MPFQPIARRTFLRGLGAAIALPSLEAMASSEVAAAAGTAQSVGATGGAPTRMAFFYVPNGVHMPDWRPQGDGDNFALPSILQPLEKVRRHVSVMSGLAVENAEAKGDGPGDHARSAAAFLTGRHPVKTDGRDIRVGVSVDQIAARHLAGDTPFPSLEIGCEAGRTAGDCDSGYACAYTDSISWRSATQPAGKEVNPKLLFDRLMGGGTKSDIAESQYRRRERKQSILDFVTEDARSIERRVGKNDRRKIEQYLESVREVERRVDNPASRLVENLDAKAMQRPEGIPKNSGEHIRLMGDLMTLAFQADLTRVSTLMVANEGSNRRYKELDLNEGHHQLSHHQRDPRKTAAISRINRHHIEQFAYILQRMSEIEEGEGTLLDNTAIVYGSAIADGNRHNHHNLPVLLAGGAGGRIEGGKHRKYPKHTPLMNLFLTLLQQTGVPVQSVGDSTGTLSLA